MRQLDIAQRTLIRKIGYDDLQIIIPKSKLYVIVEAFHNDVFVRRKVKSSSDIRTRTRVHEQCQFFTDLSTSSELAVSPKAFTAEPDVLRVTSVALKPQKDLNDCLRAPRRGSNLVLDRHWGQRRLRGPSPYLRPESASRMC
ncbi:hypothetical protein EVAR_10659_1 [Eumeta japonica]|uniref:Uncharacterized protein n=1 Tax=Eumeta variegata TaxID=151549 RepID=A0A4C1U7A6_EUMVA|nr:hypothetical protein EVAR_10659_1 [Eumeta japonica]